MPSRRRMRGARARRHSVVQGQRINARVDMVGISDFTTFLTSTERYRRNLHRARYDDARARVKAAFGRPSPLQNLAKIRAPPFVAQGRNDPRVSYTEAEQIVQAVRGNGETVSPDV